MTTQQASKAVVWHPSPTWQRKKRVKLLYGTLVLYDYAAGEQSCCCCMLGAGQERVKISTCVPCITIQQTNDKNTGKTSHGPLICSQSCPLIDNITVLFFSKAFSFANLGLLNKHRWHNVFSLSINVSIPANFQAVVCIFLILIFTSSPPPPPPPTQQQQPVYPQ